ncbi:hypothetical protein CNR34_00006 [Pseudomonas phage nickie]|uniref:Uncharacterized protein n=1 Tax=Pseudomonas phage nickie TaxID=2048977 RepID=A0A2H4P6Y8_9CAUD|nr:hypothetical protein FDJ16_gp159 [Pseudomonas phage nickie]ATW57939.1 hypothetical protein CNR34_00006 [Pseudomonas phage nickie]
MSFRDDKPDTPVSQALERIKQRKEAERAEQRRPMNPDRDLSWENTNFKDYDND